MACCYTQMGQKAPAITCLEAVLDNGERVGRAHTGWGRVGVAACVQRGWVRMQGRQGDGSYVRQGGDNPEGAGEPVHRWTLLGACGWQGSGKGQEEHTCSAVVPLGRLVGVAWRGVGGGGGGGGRQVCVREWGEPGCSALAPTAQALSLRSPCCLPEVAGSPSPPPCPKRSYLSASRDGLPAVPSLLCRGSNQPTGTNKSAHHPPPTTTTTQPAGLALPFPSRRAAAAGFEDYATIRSDPDLAPLRGRDLDGLLDR